MQYSPLLIFSPQFRRSRKRSLVYHHHLPSINRQLSLEFFKSFSLPTTSEESQSTNQSRKERSAAAQLRYQVLVKRKGIEVCNGEEEVQSKAGAEEAHGQARQRFLLPLLQPWQWR